MTLGFAVNAFFCFRFGAASMLDGCALFGDQDAFLASFANQFQRGKNTCGTCADDQNVFFHDIIIFLL